MYLTRNQAYRKVSGVRIPPSPPGKSSLEAGFLRYGRGEENPGVKSASADVARRLDNVVAKAGGAR